MKKLYAMILAMAATVSAGATDYYLIGGFNNWTCGDPNCVFTDNGNGEYLLNLQGTLISGFKINDGTWNNNDCNYGSNGTALVPEEKYSLVNSGSSGNITMSGNITNPTILFYPAEPSLIIKGQETEVEYGYAIHGQIFGDTNWSSVNMEKGEDDLWTLTASVVPGLFGIKQIDMATGLQTDWYASAEPDQTIASVPYSVACMIEGSNWNSTLSGEYTFTFNAKTEMLSVDVANGVQAIEADMTNAVYFNLQGVKVDNPAEGPYIEVRGSAVRKVMVK